MSEWAGSNNSRRDAVSIIHCFSKYAWLLPITQKKTEKVLEVLGVNSDISVRVIFAKSHLSGI